MRERKADPADRIDTEWEGVDPERSHRAVPVQRSRVRSPSQYQSSVSLCQIVSGFSQTCSRASKCVRGALGRRFMPHRVESARGEERHPASPGHAAPIPARWRWYRPSA